MKTAPAPGSLHVLAGHRDLVDTCASVVVEHFSDALPDLRSAVIIMPHQLQQAELRRRLLKRMQPHGHTALLPPFIGTLNSLFRQRMLPRPEVLSEHDCALLIAEALHERPKLLLHASRWEFAKQFLRLFDEAVEAHPQTLPMNLDATVATEVIQQLYKAWYTIQEKTPDIRAIYRESLKQNTLPGDDEHVFICGLGELSKNEIAWANRLYAAGRLTLIIHTQANGRYVSPTLQTAEMITGKTLALPATEKPFAIFLDAVFSAGEIMATRAREIGKRFAESPARHRLNVFKPDTLEQHAHGIYLKTRDWLEAGIAPVAIISQDRKLSRRLRAMFEHGGVPLRDHAGWALSTTASAGTLAALLVASERGFDRNTILALARSPYCRYGIDIERTQVAGACIERKLATLDPFKNLDETVAALLENDWRHSIPNQAHEDTGLIVRRISDSLADLRRAADNQKLPLARLFEALFACMNTLGMIAGLQQDDAGAVLVEELEIMATAARRQGIRGNWNLWRGWILHTLEHKRFTPKEHRYLVELYSLPQATLVRPGGLIIAALDAAHTTPMDPMPLLDEDLRQILGMNGRDWYVALRFDWFRTALGSTERTLLSCQKADNNRALTPVPWLDSLQHFHTLAYGDDLEDRALKHRAETTCRIMAKVDPRPVLQPQMPVPRIPEWDNKLSVRAVQTALACPYRFFASKTLRLESVPEADTYDSSRVYGLRMHRCMAALHKKIDRLPGPMDKPWTKANRNYALELASHIVESHFTPDVEHHYSAVEGMLQTLRSIKWYVNWLIDNIGYSDSDVQFEAEVSVEKTLPGGLCLYGRPDCVIHKNDGKHILDYKSRRAPLRKEMLGGEDIQLVAYALLYDSVLAVSYLNMKKHEVVTLEGAELEEAREKLHTRLQTFKADAAKLPFPAWARDQDCEYCDYSGVCRRNQWRSMEFRNCAFGSPAAAPGESR